LNRNEGGTVWGPEQERRLFEDFSRKINDALKARRYDLVARHGDELQRNLRSLNEPDVEYRVKNVRNELIRLFAAAGRYGEAESVARSFLVLTKSDQACPNRLSVVYQIIGRIEKGKGDPAGAERDLSHAVTLSRELLEEIQGRIPSR
jgi:Flp pilus assembly protein TadD